MWVGSHPIGDFFLSDDKNINQSPIQRVKKRCQYRDTFCRFILWWLEWTVQFLSNLNFGSANCRTIVFFNYLNFTQQSTNNWIELRHGHILFATHVGSYFWKVFQYVGHVHVGQHFPFIVLKKQGLVVLFCNVWIKEYIHDNSALFYEVFHHLLRWIQAGRYILYKFIVWKIEHSLAFL